jgi:hypothetical protein
LQNRTPGKIMRGMNGNNNHIIQWFKSDEGLCDVINFIDARKLTLAESARMAFHHVADYLGLPKQPDDITEQMYREFDIYDFEPQSVFEQIAVINYMADANDDIRGLVMQALYNVHHKDYHGMEYAAEIYFGGIDKIPASLTY